MIDKTDFLVSEITNYLELKDKTGSIITNTLYHVLATVPNRNSLDDLEGCEKTYIGTAIEKIGFKLLVYQSSILRIKLIS